MSGHSYSTGSSRHAVHTAKSAHWTFEGPKPFKIGFQYRITHALCKVQNEMVAVLTNGGVSRGIPIAQSTAGITTTESAATLARHRHKHSLREKYMPRPVESAQVPKLAPQVLGEPQGIIRAMKLPANGHSVEIVDLQIFAKGPDAQDAAGDTVIDFSPFWPDNPTDHRDSPLGVECNGPTQVFYTLQSDLALNQYIMACLGL